MKTNYQDGNRIRNYSEEIIRIMEIERLYKFNMYFERLIRLCKKQLEGVETETLSLNQLLQLTIFNSENKCYLKDISDETKIKMLGFIMYYKENQRKLYHLLNKYVKLMYEKEEYAEYLANCHMDRYFENIISDHTEYAFVENAIRKINEDNSLLFNDIASLFLFLYYTAVREASNVFSDYHIALDGLSVIQNLHYRKNITEKELLISEIKLSSYYKKFFPKNICLNNLTINELLELHEKCLLYATNSIVNGIWSPQNNTNQSYCVRRLTSYDEGNDIFKTLQNREYMSYSIITEETPSIFYGVYPVVFGFSEIPKENIFHIFPFDSAANSSSPDITNTPNFMLDLEDLNARTAINNSYNQLTIYSNRNENVVKPSYILVRDNEEIKLSKKIASQLNVPLVKIKTLKKPNDVDQVIPYV